jgi:hypothetical protein
MAKNDYYALKASFHEWLEIEILEAPISRVYLEYKAAKRFGFGARIVNHAIDNLITIGMAKEDEPGLIEIQRRADA